MTTKKVEVLTVKSQAYSHATSVDAIYAVAKWCLANVSGYPVKDSIAKETREQFYQGYRLRHSEVYKAQTSIDDAGKEVTVTVAMAYSYTANEFGKLKDTQPKLHKAVGDVRKASDKYCNQRYTRILAQGVAIQNEGKPRAPRQTKTVREQCAKYCDDMEQKIKLHVGKEIENKATLDTALLTLTAFKNKMEELLKNIN